MDILIIEMIIIPYMDLETLISMSNSNKYFYNVCKSIIYSNPIMILRQNRAYHIIRTLKFSSSSRVKKFYNVNSKKIKNH